MVLASEELQYVQYFQYLQYILYPKLRLKSYHTVKCINQSHPVSNMIAKEMFVKCDSGFSENPGIDR